MHELSVCQALVRKVIDIANDAQASAVTDIHVAIGPLSGIEAGLLRAAFTVAAAGTVAGGAMLHMQTMTVRVRCNSCGAESTARPNNLVCGDCRDWRTQLVSGDELLLERVCLDRDLPRMSA